MGVRLFLPDTNILIYGLAGEKPHGECLKTWIKEKTLALSASYRKKFLGKNYTLRLPDCLIAATAKLYGATLVTFDLKDFPMKDIKKLKL